MPLEHVEWFMKQSAHDNGQLHARQCCTYYSVMNVNKTNYPFLSSYEQEQTWTLTRTMSNNHKRYQSSIENIYLTTPNLSLKTKPIDYENIKNDKDHSMSLFPSSSSSDCASFSAHRIGMKAISHQAQKTLPIKIISNKNAKLKNNSDSNKPRVLTRPMRVIHANGELVVRI